MKNNHESDGENTIITILDPWAELANEPKKKGLNFYELKSLIDNGVVKYIGEWKEIPSGGTESVPCACEEWVFPMSMKAEALILACQVWDEGVSLSVPTRDTRVLLDEQVGTITLKRTNFRGPASFKK